MEGSEGFLLRQKQMADLRFSGAEFRAQVKKSNIVRLGQNCCQDSGFRGDANSPG